MVDRDERDDLDVVCPLCHGKLLVDRQTGVVLDAVAPRKSGDIDDLLDEVHAAESRRAEEFTRAFETERRRRELLERKFRLARDRSEDGPGGRGDPLGGA